MATVLTARAVIEAEDRTGTVFSALGQKIDALSAKAAKISPTIDRLSSPSAERIGKLAQAESAMSRATVALGSFTAGLVTMAGAASVATASIHAAAQRIHETQRMISSGMKSGGNRRGHSQGRRDYSEFPSLSTTEVMHQIRNARPMVGSTEEAIHVADDMSRLKVIAQAAHPGADVTEDMDKLLKGIEQEGGTQDPAKFHRMMRWNCEGPERVRRYPQTIPIL